MTLILDLQPKIERGLLAQAQSKWSLTRYLVDTNLPSDLPKSVPDSRGKR